LQHHIDISLTVHADTGTGEKALNGFENFYIRLKELTKSTGHYFENLIQAFENNWSEVGNARGGSWEA